MRWLNGPAAAFENLKAEVKAKLNHAAVALEQARSTLLRSRPDVERWARLGLLEAYLQAENLLYLAWERGGGQAKRSHLADDKKRRAEPAPVDSPTDTSIQQGLRALGDVVDLCWNDDIRWEEVESLWLRFLTAFLFFEKNVGRAGESNRLSAWKSNNETADLWRHFETPGITEFCETLIHGWTKFAPRSIKRSPNTSAADKLRAQLIDVEEGVQKDHLPRLKSLFSQDRRRRRKEIARTRMPAEPAQRRAR